LAPSIFFAGHTPPFLIRARKTVFDRDYIRRGWDRMTASLETRNQPMKTKIICSLFTLVGLLALQPTANATFHLAQIEQVIGGVNGDTTAQAIQMRMRATGQNFVSGAKLIAFDAAGLNPVTILDLSSDVANGALGSHVLIVSANFPSHTTPTTVPDFTMTNLIPASYLAAGSLAWESDTGTVYWRLSWGGASYTGSGTGNTANDVDGNFNPPFGSALPSSGASAVQFQGTASAKSTNNAADYLVTAGAAVFMNNAGASFTVNGAALPVVSMTVTDGSASEVPSTDVGKIRVNRTGATTAVLNVLYSVGGTATNGSDYQRLRGRATIRSGASSVIVQIRPIDDAIPESDETVILTLLPNASYTIGSPSSGTVTIHSNE